MNSYIMVIDQGTTGTQVGFYQASSLKLIAQAKCEFPQCYPAPGWVEHDCRDIWHSLTEAYQKASEVAGRAVNGFSPLQICALAVTNQRETCAAWSRKTSETACNAIVWQDRRTQEQCKSLKAKNREGFINERTGLLLDPYFSATKWQWMLKNVPAVKQLAQSNDLCLGTIDSWLIWRISQGASHVTDHTNASRTMLYNLHTGDWDDELLAEFQIQKSYLPTIVNSIGICAKTKGFLDLPDDIPIAGCIGDQQSALFGQNCEQPGSAKITFGTGSFLLVHTGQQPLTRLDGILTTVALAESGQPRTFAREGAAFVAGAAVQFVRDNLGWISTAAEIENMAASCARDPNLLFVPAFAGLPAPWWNSGAKATLFGLTRGTSKEQIARAILESIALQNVAIINAMTNNTDSKQKLTKVLVDGGAVSNNTLMQFQCNVLQCELVRPSHTEATALGAAKCAARALEQLFKVTENNKPNDLFTSEIHTVFQPQISQEEANTLVEPWLKAVNFVDKFYQ